MTRLRGPRAAVAAVTLTLLSACAGAGTGADGSGGSVAGGPPSSGAPAGAADGLVLRVGYSGGFAPAEALAGRIPAVSVYADGRIISEGPQIAIYPGPALPNLQLQQADPATVAALAEDARAAGVRPGTDFGSPGVADAPDTRITVRTAQGALETVSVTALAEARPDDPKLTPAQREARTRLAAFVDRVTGLSGTGDLPAAEYRPTGVAALAQPYTPPSDGLASQPAARDWPGPALPGAPAGTRPGLGCVAVTGADAERVLGAAREARSTTPWTSDGKTWQVVLRPLLPDETGCADLEAAR